VAEAAGGGGDSGGQKGPGEAQGEGVRGEAQPGQREQQQQHLWYYISDTQVRQVQVSEVLGCQAYITMYVRSGGSSSSSSRLQQGMRGGRGGI
jgi:hypothetical protein